MNHIIESLTKLFTEFTWKKLFIFICIVIVAFAGLMFYESTTKSFKLKRIEHIAEILTKLNSIETSRVLHNKELKETYGNLTKELLEASTIEKMSLKAPDVLHRVREPEAMYKFLTAAILWWLFSLWPFSSFWKGDYGAHGAFISIAAVGILSGAIGVFIPSFSSLWYNYLLVPLLLFIIIIAVFAAIMVYSDKLAEIKKTTNN